MAAASASLGVTATTASGRSSRKLLLLIRPRSPALLDPPDDNIHVCTGSALSPAGTEPAAHCPTTTVLLQSSETVVRAAVDRCCCNAKPNTISAVGDTATAALALPRRDGVASAPSKGDAPPMICDKEADSAPALRTRLAGTCTQMRRGRQKSFVRRWSSEPA